MSHRVKTKTCKGICEKYKVNNRYEDPENGFCSKGCGIFIRWVGKCCPCCGYRLRRSPRSTSTGVRHKYRQKKGVVYQ